MLIYLVLHGLDSSQSSAYQDVAVYRIMLYYCLQKSGSDVDHGAV